MALLLPWGWGSSRGCWGWSRGDDTCFKHRKHSLRYRPAVHTLFGMRDRFLGRQFFHGLGWWGIGFGMIQAHYIYCALDFPDGSDGKESVCKGRPGFAPWVGKILRRREWHPTPIFLPGESHGQRNLGVYSPWGCKELDTTEQLTLALFSLFLSLLHQLHLRSSGIRSWRLGTPAVDHFRECKEKGE